MVERLGEMKKGRRERIEKGSRQKIEKERKEKETKWAEITISREGRRTVFSLAMHACVGGG